MDQVFMALVNYESANGHLPAAIQVGSRGRPLYSWRFAIAPMLDGALGGTSLELPWTDPANAKWRELSLDAYSYSSRARTARISNLAAVTGAGTAFDPARQGRIADLPPATIVLIDVADSGVHWMEPGGDLSVETVPSNVTGGVDGSGVHVAFADGLIWFLRPDVPVEDLEKFFTVKGAVSNNRDALLRPYLIDEYEGHWHRYNRERIEGNL